MTQQNDNPVSSIVSKRIVLEELRWALDRMHDASIQLDSKLYALLQSASLIVALAGLTQISAIKDRAGIWFWVGFGITLILYIAIFIFIFRGIRTRIYALPISGDWGEIHRVYVGKDEETVVTQIIADSLRYYEKHATINHEKSVAVARVMKLFVVIIVILLAAVVFGINNPVPTLR